ncbi:MAG: hypothetical protein M9936_20875 [Caldilinea sp.]|nr:hypothetical protein [Caldilinea sp.]MCB9121792.1 hypothetical protein [Caldilineaceae bacterium]MCO5212157.1 hypothetical protein [Caldilinea sp.]
MSILDAPAIAIDCPILQFNELTPHIIDADLAVAAGDLEPYALTFPGGEQQASVTPGIDGTGGSHLCTGQITGAREHMNLNLIAGGAEPAHSDLNVLAIRRQRERGANQNAAARN